MRALVVMNQFVAHQMEVWPALVRQGVEVHLLASPGGTESPEVFKPDIAVPDGVVPHRFTPRVLRKGGNTGWWLIPDLPSLVTRVCPDIIHVGSEPWGLMVSQTLRVAVPVVAQGWVNIFDFGGVWVRSLRNTLSRRNLPRLAGYVSANERGLQLAYDYGLRPTAAAAVAASYAPDAAVFEQVRRSRVRLRQQLGLSDETFAVGFIGRLSEHKGVVELQQAARLAHDQLGGSFELFVVGDGPLAGHLRSAQEPWMRMLGLLPWRATQDVLGAMDVLVVPSITVPGWAEQYGRVVIDAMTAGVPVVVSDSGALPEVVADTGVVVPERDAVRLASAIISLSQHPELRRRLASTAHRRAIDLYSADAVASRIRSAWDKVC